MSYLIFKRATGIKQFTPRVFAIQQGQIRVAVSMCPELVPSVAHFPHALPIHWPNVFIIRLPEGPKTLNDRQVVIDISGSHKESSRDVMPHEQREGVLVIVGIAVVESNPNRWFP